MNQSALRRKLLGPLREVLAVAIDRPPVLLNLLRRAVGKPPLREVIVYVLACGHRIPLNRRSLFVREEPGRIRCPECLADPRLRHLRGRPWSEPVR